MKTKIQIVCTFLSVLSAATALWITLRPQPKITISCYGEQIPPDNGLPIVFHSGQMFVHGMVNGKPALFLIDSGANVCVFNENKLEHFSINKSGAARKVRLAGNASVTSQLVETFIVDFPSIKVKAEIQLADCTSMIARNGVDVDCLLGNDFLRAISAQIDYQKMLLIFQCKDIANQRVEPTVKTPVESGKAQGTAAHL